MRKRTIHAVVVTEAAAADTGVEEEVGLKAKKRKTTRTKSNPSSAANKVSQEGREAIAKVENAVLDVESARRKRGSRLRSKTAA